MGSPPAQQHLGSAPGRMRCGSEPGCSLSQVKPAQTIRITVLDVDLDDTEGENHCVEYVSIYRYVLQQLHVAQWVARWTVERAIPTAAHHHPQDL